LDGDQCRVEHAATTWESREAQIPRDFRPSVIAVDGRCFPKVLTSKFVVFVRLSLFGVFKRLTLMTSKVVVNVLALRFYTNDLAGSVGVDEKSEKFCCSVTVLLKVDIR
jgi:hypothetical protein